jgi:hypothetical protein
MTKGSFFLRAEINVWKNIADEPYSFGLCNKAKEGEDGAKFFPQD